MFYVTEEGGKRTERCGWRVTDADTDADILDQKWVRQAAFHVQTGSVHSILFLLLTL